LAWLEIVEVLADPAGVGKVGLDVTGNVVGSGGSTSCRESR
jgi:hypothetical protein